ncbi:hypothetical protein ACFWZY_01685 [Streptomyces sp. NPDC058992]|uniref:hypothetical protein n=1 Tax=Streptomyces sp. NPDC058992 TaxID=3346688 RepID=UPI00367D2D20
MSAAVAYVAEAAACPSPPRAATSARPRAGAGLRVRVPLRLVVGVQYSDAALAVYIKVAALGMRPEGCTAKVETIADYLGASKSFVERALKELSRPDPVDGITEVVTTRRTLPGGTGQSAHRVVRQADEDEAFVWVPARAGTALAPRLLRLYALVSYAQARRMPLGLADLAAVLRHQSGRAAGEPIGERQTSRLVDQLAATGWATVRHREGLQGRHAYEAHLRPLHPVAAQVCPDINDGSGPGDHDGSPVSEEDTRTDRPLKSAGGSRGIRRRRLQEVPRGPVDSPAAGTFRPARGRGTSGANGGKPGDGTGGTLSVRAWTVLEPVRHLLDGTRPFVLARIESELARQLAAGIGMERITARLTRRYATTRAVRDGARWILGAGLPRRGCGLDACEDGVIWHTGQACQVCLDITLAAAAPAASEPEPAPPAPAAEPDPPPMQLPPGPEPPALTRAQRQALRDAAGPDTVAAAVAQYGRARAICLYGHAAVIPYLNELDRQGGEQHAEQ